MQSTVGSRTPRKQGFDHVHDGVEEVLAVVENEQTAAATLQLHDDVPDVCTSEADGDAGGTNHLVTSVQGGQFDQPRAASEDFRLAQRELADQTGLTDTTRSDGSHQTRAADQATLVDLLLPPDEAGPRLLDVRTTSRRRARGCRLPGQPPQPDRIRDVLQREAAHVHRGSDARRTRRRELPDQRVGDQGWPALAAPETRAATLTGSAR